MPLGGKRLQDRGLESMQKIVTNKVPTYVKKLLKNEVPNKDLFVVLEGLGPKGAQRGPKDLPRHPPRSNFVQICEKNVFETVFLWGFTKACPRLGGKT